MAAIPMVKLAEYVDLLAGFAFDSANFTNDPADIPLVKGENVSQGSILWGISKRWSVAEWSNFEKYQLQSGDVIVAMDRPWVPAGLKWAYIRKEDPKALLVQRCSRLRSNSTKLDQDFLRFVVGGSGFESYIKPITTGVNVPHISGRQILDYEFLLPTLPVQQRIAGILMAYDELIENSQQRIKILESMARALYREWFVQLRYPGHESVPLLPSALGDIPRGCEVMKLGDLCELRKDQYRDSEHSELPLVDMARMPSRSLAPSNTGTPDELATSRILFESGDTLFGAIRCYLHKVVTVHYPGVTNTSVLVLRPKAECFRALLAIIASDIDTIRWAEKQSTGTKMPVINWGVFQGMPTPIPSKTLAQSFEEVAGPMLDEIGVLATKIENLRRTRDLLLPRLLSGQIDVETIAA
jgi:type I restriction enzyme S subunit